MSYDDRELHAEISARPNVVRYKRKYEEQHGVPYVVSRINHGLIPADKEAKQYETFAAFKARYGVVQDDKGKECVYRLFKKCYPQTHYNYENGHFRFKLPLEDHASIWKRKGKVFAYVYQPYSNVERKFGTSLAPYMPVFEEFTAKHGLEVYINPEESFWNAPLTTFVMLTRAR